MDTDGHQTTGVDNLLSVAEAAELLKVSTRTIRRAIDSGRLPAYRIGGLIRINRADVTSPTFMRPVAS